ncbi:MAG: lipid-A-disaccharide synthase [Elainellaceae cyanobacterium]
MTPGTDILILSNGPGEISTWVRPVVQALRQQLGPEPLGAAQLDIEQSGKAQRQHRISLVLSPCPNASGKEVAIAQRYPEIDRIQGAAHFFPFLLWGKTQDNWDWRDRGVVVFLGGDQIYPILIARRLGYRTVIYGEWDTRWHRWGDRYGVMNAGLVERVPSAYRHKVSVVGDLMADVSCGLVAEAGQQDMASTPPVAPLIGLLPGSKPAKLTQGMPFCLAIAAHVHRVRPEARFLMPVAPTLDPKTLLQYAQSANPFVQRFESPLVSLRRSPNLALELGGGGVVELHTGFPAYDRLRRCRVCVTTVGANTAELGALGIPMLVILPTQQLDAMRAWDGIPGLLVNLPGVGSLLARGINAWFLRKKRLLAWPNIWAGEEIVPELVGHLQPQDVAQQLLDLLAHPEALAQMSHRLRQARGEPGAAARLASLVKAQIES